MNKHKIIFILLISVLIFSCKKENKNDVNTNNHLQYNDIEETKINIDLKPINNSLVIGNVIITEKNGQVNLISLVNHLKPGTYSMYILDSSDCINTYENEELHWNPTNQKHGVWGSSLGFHKGDIGHFKADNLGNGTINFSTTEWCIDCDDFKKNLEGKSLVICEVNNKKSRRILSCGLIKNE